MTIQWFDQDFRLAIRVRQNVLEFSKEAYQKFGNKQVTIGIDKDERLVFVKECDRFGYEINYSKAIIRICSTSLTRWLKNNGVEYKRYAAWWDEKNNMLVAKY